MATILSYFIEYETYDGNLREAEVNVDYNDVVALSPDNALDETARRHIISTVLKEGGRVIKIRRTTNE